jgi:hypothetical protein
VLGVTATTRRDTCDEVEGRDDKAVMVCDARNVDEITSAADRRYGKGVTCPR